MKKLLVTFLLIITSFLGFGQSVSAPDSKSFTPSTNGQDASGFVLSGFSSTSTLLASISLINPSTGTTFYLNTTTGLTAASGFTLSGNKTRLVITGTMNDINIALANLKVNTGSVVGSVQLSVAATVNPVGYYYNGVNGHFYRPITTGTTYTNARALSLQQTFKGQQGYLVTITSASEDQFIIANVPQANIWFAATDEVTEGVWIIDAGPEKGTIIKTQNGQLNGNVQGQYNNWAGGEPNNSGNEDYPVTKWGGGTQWNDLPNNFSCAYVVEFGTWTNPDDATFTEFYTNSVSHSNGDVLRASFNIDFGGNVDETKFSAKGYTYTNNTWNLVNGTTKQLSGLGKVDLTSGLDTAKISMGSKAVVIPGQVEWSLMQLWNGVNYISIDGRKLNGTQPTDVTQVNVLDIYEGPVTFYSWDGTWATYSLPVLVPKLSDGTSAYNSLIRPFGGIYYGLSCDVSFISNTKYKPHGIELSYVNQTDLNTLYSNIVSVSDVYLAFKELSDKGIFGNQSGMGLTKGIQYMNADVDMNGVFDENDTYKLLQHLTGVQSLSQYTALTYLMKLYNKSDYDSITPNNWNTQFNNTRNLIPFTLSGLNNTYNISVSWLGDVNLSHSAQPATNGITTMSMKTMSLTTNSVSNQINAELISENVGGNLVVTISIDPLQQELVGTQFQLNYDNTALKFGKVEFVTKGNPTNFGTDKGTYVTLGSLITDGSTTLDKTTQYKITFSPLIGLSSVLGLTSISATDAVSKNGTQLKVKVN